MGISIAPAVPRLALCVPDLGPRKRDSSLQFMLAHARDAGALLDLVSVHDALLLLERHGGSAIGKGVALPNARALGVLEPRWILARSARGIDWGAPDGQPVQLVVMVLSPPDLKVSAHLDSVARAASLTRLARARTRLLEARGAAEMAALVRQAIS